MFISISISIASPYFTNVPICSPLTALTIFSGSAIPGNDDAIRAVKLIADVMANAVIEGKQGESFEAEESEEQVEATEPESMEEVVENAEEVTE